MSLLHLPLPQLHQSTSILAMSTLLSLHLLKLLPASPWQFPGPQGLKQPPSGALLASALPSLPGAGLNQGHLTVKAEQLVEQRYG